MTDFSHLQQLNVSSTKTVDYEFLEIPGTPIFTIKPATEANKPLYNALLRRGKKTNQQLKAKGLTAEMVSSYRDEDRELYAKHVVVGWKNVQDSEGKEPKFSSEECLAFLKALPNYIFDGLRDFASNERNFVEDTIDVEQTSKNS